MFKVRAEFHEDLEVGAGMGRVRAFFADLDNFARLMPGVESIHLEENGVALWRVSVEVSLIGAMRGTFALAQRDDSAARIEWGPAPNEKKNLLRYAIALEERTEARTLMRVALRVELRRESARELHLMAGLLGEARVSAGTEEEVALMMKTFLRRARAELEATA
ncbi:MAG TPA: SRPBCC domain-containing protein [Pyrinomonadaceae bacterium]|nr:SRPBCC domain-containing protein [Pyrinomonadaceae bacterium]